jgi:hypothetical protein
LEGTFAGKLKEISGYGEEHFFIGRGNTDQSMIVENLPR